jgi:hypothetical protein
VVAGDFDDEESDFVEESDLAEPSLDELDFSEEELDASLEDELSELGAELELDELPPELFDASRLSLR